MVLNAETVCDVYCIVQVTAVRVAARVAVKRCVNAVLCTRVCVCVRADHNGAAARWYVHVGTCKVENRREAVIHRNGVQARMV